MSVHIGAKKGDIAETVLMPGDPLRAKYIAENFLENPVCYTEVRGMYGFTGTYKGKKVSIQGSGMGIPSIGIYVNELIDQYDVKRIMRIGSCGSFKEEVKIRDIILGMSASTNSSLNDITFRGMTFAPTASYSLFAKAVQAAEKLNIDFHAGNILSTDIFYNDDPEEWKIWRDHNVLAVEMEAAALYTLAAKKGIEALTILTVSDSFITSEVTTSEEREKTFTQMMELALETAIA
ncbi:MAG: purine-nucleoside phosphorylase [Spirochaetales bacterium]|nr:purine-nucleoside phosphorylase [Spirochaetales bacterium]